MKKYSQLEIIDKLDRYKLIINEEDYKNINQWDVIKYIKKETGVYSEGGLVLMKMNNKKIMIQGFYKNKFNKYNKWVIDLNKYIIFVKKNLI